MLSAAKVYGWYNSSLSMDSHELEIASPVVVLVGNGNVALDIARILLSARDDLADSDIAERAVDHISAGATRTVVVLGRRGPAHAAFTTPELVGLSHRDGVTVRVEPAGVLEDALAGDDLTPSLRTKLELMQELDRRPAGEDDRIVVLRFWSRPAALLGDEAVAGVRLIEQRPGAEAEDHDIATSCVISSIGLDGVALPGVPFDQDRRRIPTEEHRVVAEGGVVVPGAYAVGWVAQGSAGGIGVNKLLAQQVASAVEDDFIHGRLDLVTSDGVEAITKAIAAGQSRPGWGMPEWKLLDAIERAAAQGTGRPRVKATSNEYLLELLSAHGVSPT